MLGTEERRALYVPLEDKSWAFIGPSPTWDSETGLFVGYRVGLYDEEYNIVSFEERLFPMWTEFVFPILEWEARRDRVILKMVALEDEEV